MPCVVGVRCLRTVLVAQTSDLTRQASAVVRDGLSEPRGSVKQKMETQRLYASHECVKKSPAKIDFVLATGSRVLKTGP